MIGYKLNVEGQVRPDLLRRVYERLRNEEMTLEFNIAPKTEADQPKLEWFEKNCPNQFIADCIRRVIRRAQGLAQVAFVHKDTDRFMYYYAEAAAILDIFLNWQNTIEVTQVLLGEKTKLEAYAKEQGFEAETQEEQDAIMKPPGEQKEHGDRPVDPNAVVVGMRDVLVLVKEVANNPPMNCPTCVENNEGDEGITAHQEDCISARAAVLMPWLGALVEEEKKPPKPEPEPPPF